MARILLNTRASRVTIVDNILLLPAEVKKDESLGKVVKPSRTLISERPTRKGPSPYERVCKCRGTQKLMRAGVIYWSRNPDGSDELVDESTEAEKEHVKEAEAEAKAAAGRETDEQAQRDRELLKAHRAEREELERAKTESAAADKASAKSSEQPSAKGGAKKTESAPPKVAGVKGG